MNVVDLLPDHPLAPQRNRFEAFLPNLVTICMYPKSNLFAYPDNTPCREALERAYEFLDSTIARITYQMKMIRHQYVSDQLGGPLLVQRGGSSRKALQQAGSVKTGWRSRKFPVTKCNAPGRFTFDHLRAI